MFNSFVKESSGKFAGIRHVFEENGNDAASSGVGFSVATHSSNPDIGTLAAHGLKIASDPEGEALSGKLSECTLYLDHAFKFAMKISLNVGPEAWSSRTPQHDIL